MEENLLEKYQDALDSAKVEAAQHGIARTQQEAFSQPEETSIAKEQLDLSEEIARIDYLLKGYSLEPGENGKLMWVAPVDKDMIIFTEYGIHLIRNTICWYLNKNLLLSNFDDEMIKRKMLDFTNDLIDTISMEYEKVFIQPTVEDCIDALKKRMERKTEITCYAKEVAGLEVNKDEIYKEKMDELENKIEVELEKIKQNIMKSKLKRYLMTVRVIQDAIHATFLRAFKGEERRTLRQHYHISETKGTPIASQQQKTGGMWPWSKK